MRTDHPLTLTVEQAAEVLGIGRSTAYELVRTGELKCIRLRRRIVVPVAHLAESLGVDGEAVWTVLARRASVMNTGGSSTTTPNHVVRARRP